MGDAIWDRVRKKTYADAKHCCEICGVHPDRLDCHEVWDYDDDNHVQRLVRLIALCPLCHGVKHFARSRIYRTKEQIEELARHFMTVNDCGPRTLVDHYDSEMAKWKARSAHAEWKADWGEYARLAAS